jgi:hypothetical protein
MTGRRRIAGTAEEQEVTMNSSMSFLDHSPTGIRHLFTQVRTMLGRFVNRVWEKASTLDYLGEVGGF